MTSSVWVQSTTQGHAMSCGPKLNYKVEIKRKRSQTFSTRLSLSPGDAFDPVATYQARQESVCL